VAAAALGEENIWSFVKTRSSVSCSLKCPIFCK